MPRVEAFAKEVSVIPVLFVLAATAVKDGFEELRRHRADQKAFTPEEFSWPVEVEAPNAELYHFSGRIYSPEPVIVRKDNLLLRGCIVRNTDTVEGMVIYAGRETKAALNNSGRKFKRSKLERRLNRDIIWCILILVILCITGSVGMFRLFYSFNYFYCHLGSYIWLHSLPGENILFLESLESKDILLSAFINFWTFVIIFQAVIPLPLYITIEGVKILQVFFMHNDLGLYDSERDRRAEVHAFNIPEDLGQVEYVFCDKTGTLTENKMVFKRAVINGVDYWVDEGTISVTHVWSFNTLTTASANTRLSAVRDFIPFVPSASARSSHSSPALGTVSTSCGKEEAGHVMPDPSVFEDNGDDSRNCQRVQDFFLCLTICNTCVVSANKNVAAPLVPLRKRKPLARLRLGSRTKNSAGDSSLTSSRFHRLFIRGSRNEIFEVGEEASADENVNTDANTPDRSMRKSLSIGSLFPRRQRKTDQASKVPEDKIRQATKPPKRLLTTVVESPRQKGGMNAELASDEGIERPSATALPISVRNPNNDTQPSSDTSVLSENGRKPAAVEPQTPPHRHLFQPKARPSNTKHLKGQQQLQQSSSVLTSDSDDWEALSQAGSSTCWRSSNDSLVNRPFHHVCPLSENTLQNGYESESPDEVTLVKTACKYGCKLLQRGSDFVIIWLPGDGLIRVEVLKVLPFVNHRKRMSIIIRHPETDQIVLYCKGADSVILSRLDPHNGQHFKVSTEERLRDYSRSGLRTLVMAKRVISESEYERWSSAWMLAEGNYQCAEELKFKLMDEIEVNLELLGATGIEDCLQQGVPETIASLREAGLKVWVLTGDKQETAISIAYAAKLITEEQRVFTLNAESAEETKRQLENFLVELLPGANFPESVSSYCPSNVPPSSPSTPPSLRMDFHGEAAEEPDQKFPQATASCNSPTILRVDSHFSAVSVLNNEVPVDIPQGSVALVLDSACLVHVLDDGVKEIFIKLARVCSSVICCRVTPSQKASVVELVKHEIGAQTLAIGDGANDVNMIQCADVGVGISGQEGMQAVMASDFAITRFAFLKRLLLVHGHWCYEKLARMALYMFYKDAVYIFSLFWFQFFNGFSGSAHINQLAQILFNVSITSIPPFVLGVLDKPLDDQTLMANPKLYRNGRDSMTYRSWHFWVNTLDAMWQSLVIFFIPCLVFHYTNASMDELGSTCMNALVFTSLVHIALETKYFTIIHWIAYVGSYLVLWLFFTMAYNALGVTEIAPDPPYYVIFVLMGDLRFWLCMVITSTTALLPRLLMNSLSNTFAPSLDTLAARLQRKYGVGTSLPIGRYVEEHDACQEKRNLRGRVRVGEANIRSRIVSWFTSAGRLLQRMPALRRNIDEPSVVLVRNVSLVWTKQDPELIAHTLPRFRPVAGNPQRNLRRANTFGGNGDFNGQTQTHSRCLVNFSGL
ncbi:unnamed protein product [Mesocestoides corti]|uniref:P-type ATPase C-terminal domain-containing protein n=1 Tax=Mesocestoides corti TaxID=53468 RepID=A0A158QUA1_MESCO|nr:unnamed protein product [Mesocestoides corti]